MKERGREGDATAELCPWGGTGRARGAAPRPEPGSARRTRSARGTWAGPGAGLSPASLPVDVSLSVFTTPQLSSPSPGWKFLGFKEKRRRGQGADPGGAVLEEAALPLGPAVPPGCGSSPRFVLCRFFGGSGSPPGRREAAQRPDRAAATGLGSVCCHFSNLEILFSLLSPIPGADPYREQRILYFSVAAFVHRKLPKTSLPARLD